MATPTASTVAEVDQIDINFFPSPPAASGIEQSSKTSPECSTGCGDLLRFATDLPANLAPMALTGLGESRTERWSESGPTEPVSHGRFTGRQGKAMTYLGVCLKVTKLNDMRQITFELYRELLAALAELGVPRLVRIWNYIPQINAGSGDNECYRQFCWGRAEALGDTILPAATAIGSKDGWLRISVLSTGPAGEPASLGVRHIENHRQLSAYRYPRDYGPRSPSFARATLVSPAEGDDRQSLLLVSGTSSIVHHTTLHAGDLAAQTAETLRNIKALFKSLRTESAPDSKPVPVPLALRYYLRSAGDLANAKTGWASSAGHWPTPTWYEGDICRSDLAMEVEGVFSV